MQTQRRSAILTLGLFALAAGFWAIPSAGARADEPRKELKAGIIGLDTSHAIAFTSLLNGAGVPEDLAGCRIVAAYPKGSPDIESSTLRVPGYIEQVVKMNVEIVDSIPALLEKVDVVFLETNDGRPHLEQLIPVLKAGKPCFIDKPVAGSLTDAVAIYELARKYNVPVFTSSSLRYYEGVQDVRDGKVGKVQHAETFSPASLEPTHPDLFWYGIHGVELLFATMGTGCVSATRTISNADMDEVAGVWENDRSGIFRGYRAGKGGYGGTAKGTEGEAEFGSKGGYRELLVEIVKFFRTGVAPVGEEESLEIYAFMEAADESKRQGGKPVTLASVMEKAHAEAESVIAENAPADNKLTTYEEANGWRLLFDGESLDGWKCNNGKEVATPIEQNSIVPYQSGGYLVIHEDQFSDFVFRCDVLMGDDCNSGVFFRIGDPNDPVQTGIEAQVLSGTGTGMHDFGALYDLVPIRENATHGPGKWDTLEITCKGPLMSVAVNGVQVASLNADEWVEPGVRPDGSAYKFTKALKDFPRKGYLGFQDHGHKVWFKNVKILELAE
ncbi:MAG: family 16 glycoside hydrolase [Planctomycetaceae bacterium]